MAVTALYDACVLYPAPLRDLLMHLALTGLFRARWMDQIHDEWTRNVRKDRPDLPPGKLERVRALMDDHVQDCLVTGYESLIPTLMLPDADDRHVLAAAIHGQAGIVVTYNLSDFPSQTLSRYGIEVQHPDEFILTLLDLDWRRVTTTVKDQRANLRHPPKTAQEMLETLEQQRLGQTVAHLRPLLA